MFTPTKQDDVQRPHATLFARLFAEPELAWITLGAVMPAILPALERESLRLVTNQLINDQLGERFADLLFEAQLVDGGSALVRILFEHKSWADPFTVVQVAAYSLRILEEHLGKVEHRVRGRLPLVLPVVVLHDPAGQELSTQITDLVDAPPEVLQSVGDHTLNLHLLVDDLMALSFEDVAARSTSPVYRLAVWLLRSRGEEPEERFEAYRQAWAELLADGRHGAISALLHYAMRVGRDPDSVPLRAAKAVDPRLGEEAMSYGDRLIQQGVEQGRKEGRKEGRNEGRNEGLREGQANLLLKLLTLRFGEVPEDLRARIASADVAELERWGERLIAAPDLATLLANE